MSVIVTDPDSVVVVEDNLGNLTITQSINPVTVLGGSSVMVVQENPVIVAESTGGNITLQGGLPGPVGPRGPAGVSDLLYVKKTSDYFATFDVDNIIDVDCSNGPVVIHLPLMSNTYIAYLFRVKKVDSSGNSVSVLSTNGQLIDGFGGSFDIIEEWETYDFVGNGSGYNVY